MFLSDARQPVDCKTVGFFSKSVKKSVKRGVRVLRARSARASHARLTARAYLNTQKYGLFCSLVNQKWTFCMFFAQFFGQIGSKRVIKLNSTYLVVSMHIRQKKAWFPFEKRRPTTSSLKLSNISPSHPQKWPFHITYTYISKFLNLFKFSRRRRK